MVVGKGLETPERLRLVLGHRLSRVPEGLREGPSI